MYGEKMGKKRRKGRRRRVGERITEKDDGWGAEREKKAKDWQSDEKGEEGELEREWRRRASNREKRASNRRWEEKAKRQRTTDREE